MGMVEGRQLLIRVLPSATDIRACVKHLMALNRAGIVSILSLTTLRYIFLNEVSLPIIGYLRDTQNCIRAINAGVSLFDLPARAMRQDAEQWQPIIDWLAKSEPKTLHSMQRTIDELLGAQP